ELVDLAKNPFPLACVLAGGGGGKFGLQLLHLLLAVIAAIQFDSAFDHLSKSPESRPTRRRWRAGRLVLLSMDLPSRGTASASWRSPALTLLIVGLHPFALRHEGISVYFKFLFNRLQIVHVVGQIRNLVVREPFLLQLLVVVLSVVLQGF